MCSVKKNWGARSVLIAYISMKIRSIVSTLALLVVMAMSGQMTPRSVVTTAPEKMLLSLDNSILLDMLDYYESGVARIFKNKANEDSYIVEMTEKTLTLKTGACHNVSFVILPYGKSEIIMTIERVETPSIDATISFYDSRWQLLDTKKMLRIPALSDWIGKVSREERADIENALPFLMVDATFNPATSILTFTPMIGDYVATENVEKVKSVLAEHLEYVWSGKSFKRVKK